MSTDLGVYELVRYEDVSGVSGTGSVAEVAVFSDGTAVLHWAGKLYTTTTVHVDGVESILSIHGHNGKTVLRRIDGKSG